MLLSVMVIVSWNGGGVLEIVLTTGFSILVLTTCSESSVQIVIVGCNKGTLSVA